MNVTYLKPSKFNGKIFYAIMRRSLLRANIDEILDLNDKRRAKAIFNSHLTSHFVENNTILDYYELDDTRMIISTTLSILMID